jgi:hypothetical protein
MNQAGHIFAKDARHLRWELAISLALTAGYVLIAPVEWAAPMGSNGETALTDELRFVAMILNLLVGVSWWILITRVVQSESLVGDRQWWITKPYEWGQLLSAKLLFVGAFVVLPIAIAKSAILAEGGFAPFAYVPGLAYGLLLFAVYWILPLLAIAMVTSSFARDTLTILGVLVAFIALAAVVAIARIGGFSVWWSQWVPLAIVLSAVCVAIGLQYARRTTWTTRIILAAGLVLVSVANALSGNAALIAWTYPQKEMPLQMTLDAGSRITGYAQWNGRKRMNIAVPVQVSGIAAGTAVNLDAMQVTAEAPDGRRWTSGWESLWGARYRPNSDPDLTAPLPLQIDRAFYQAEHGNPVTLHVRFAVTELQGAAPIRVAMPTHEFAVPGFGICEPLDVGSPGEYTDLHCRNALRQPSATFIEVQWSNDPCGPAGASTSTPIAGDGWAGSVESDPSNFGINGVEEVGFQLSNNQQFVKGRQTNIPRHLCPGSPITFTPYAVGRRNEYDVTFASYQMPDLPPGDHSDN